MNIGLFFGSFNPVHNGHLIIANHIANNTNIQKIWFVISPQNPLKPSASLLNEYHRLHLVKTAIDGENKLHASNVEFHLLKPSFTIDTLSYIKEKFPEHEFSVIMGSDSFSNLQKWKNFEIIIRDYHIYIYKRPEFEVKNSFGAKITILNAPLLEISSTHIRELIKSGKSIRYLLPDSVKDEIERNNYYR